MHYSKYFYLFLLVLVACNLPSLEEIGSDAVYAIPLINDKISFQSIAEESDNFDVILSQDGQLTLRYKSELFSENIEELLPSVSSIGEVPIIDTVSIFPLATSENFVISKAIFKGDEMRFRFSHDRDEVLRINMKIPELTKDGEVFEFDFVLDPKGVIPYTEFTESFLLEGYEFNSDENVLTFRYDARNPEGERIKLTFAAMSFNLLKFKYAEGSFERTAYELLGDSIEVNVFDSWRSGEVDFEDPKISFDIEHSYGLPISLQIKNVLLRTIENENKSLNAVQLGQEIPLQFASLEEVGKSFNTSINFDKENSNIRSLFNEKIKNIDYNVEAIINPEGDLSKKGFITDESFFKLDVNLDIPLSQKVNMLALSDTIDLANLIPDAFTAAEFKFVTRNTYPINASIDLIFIDDMGVELERFFGDAPLRIEPGPEETRILDLDASKIFNLKNSTRVIIEPIFDTSSITSDFIQFLADDFLELRVGVKFEL